MMGCQQLNRASSDDMKLAQTTAGNRKAPFANKVDQTAETVRVIDACQYKTLSHSDRCTHLQLHQTRSGPFYEQLALL